MKMKPVNYTPDNLPELTPERLTELRQLEAMSDDQIDTSDAPELLAEAVRGRFYRPVKQQVTARFDAE